MRVGLLEGILGRFISGKTLNAGNKIDSIKDNLAILLNTRRGSIAHLPDYGLPDSSQVSANNRDSIIDFGKKIEETVKKYEPRLTQVRVKPLEKDSDSIAEFRLGFLLEAKVVNEDTRFHAFFKTTGSAIVRDAED